MRPGIAQGARTILTVATFDAATCQRVAEQRPAVRIGAARCATAAVRGAARPERRASTLVVFVALVADSALFVATMGAGRTSQAITAIAQATVGTRIAAEAVTAVGARQADHAALSSGIAMRRIGGGAVRIDRALDAAIVHAVQPVGTERNRSARFATLT